MITETALLDAVCLIYDAALDPSAWPAALEHLAGMLDAGGAGLALLDPHGRVAHSMHARIDDRVIASYADRYGPLDPVLQALSVRPAGLVMTDPMVCTRRELWGTRFHDEWCRPNDIEHTAQAIAFRDGGRSGFLGLNRPRRGAAFCEADLAVVQALLPHLARALRTQARLQEASVGRQDTADALDQVAQAVLLVDAGARVLHANRSAARLLRTPGGLGADAEGLRAARPEQTRALRALVARAAARRGAGGGSVLLEQPGLRLLAHVVPVGPGVEAAWVGTPRPAAVVIVAEPAGGHPGPAQAALRSLFGLTVAEGRVACLVAAGSGVAAAAAELGVGPPTVRTHLARAYAKTGTRRQAELAELVGQIAGAVGPG